MRLPLNKNYYLAIVILLQVTNTVNRHCGLCSNRMEARDRNDHQTFATLMHENMAEIRVIGLFQTCIRQLLKVSKR